jgi:guanylate kinase
MEDFIKNLNGCKIIIGGPSGSGKTTLIELFLNKFKNFNLSKSYTTRKIRENEIDGEEYFFISKESFLQMKDNNEFFETEQIFGNYYGTKNISTAQNIIFNMGIDGVLTIKKKYPEAISVFLAPPSVLELKNRLLNRNQSCLARFVDIKKQLLFSSNFDFILINDDLNETLLNLLLILKITELQKESKKLLSVILNSFDS